MSTDLTLNVTKSSTSDLKCPWIKQNLGFTNQTAKVAKSVGASKQPPTSVSFYDIDVEGVQAKLSGHINPGELVAILGDIDLRNEMLKTLAGRQQDRESGQIMF